MSTNDHKNVDDQEIDLASVSKAVSGMFQSIGRSIFRMIQFVLKHIVVLIALVIVGVGFGSYLDTTRKTYNTCIIIRPNFESTDYIYAKIDLLFSRINDNDTLFLKSIGIKSPKKLRSIKIYPIVDIYKFISESDSKDSDRNFQLFKLLAADGDMEKIILNRTTSKNYTFHQIHFVTSSKASRDEILEPLLNYLESNENFKNTKQIFIENTNLKIEANKNMIAQIDGLLSTFTNESSESAKNNKSVYINQNTQLNDLIQTKNNLVNEIGYHKYELINHDKVVKESSSIINMNDTRTIDSKLRVVLPIALLFMYLLIIGLVNFYRKQAALYKKEKL
ncbi:MAG: hypothetical protein IPP30_13665 [Flavobacterium sp.]|nr:hypothetical protein [Flavobacterium sp.]